MRTIIINTSRTIIENKVENIVVLDAYGKDLETYIKVARRMRAEKIIIC